ncbi:MAG: hypothetical protein LLF98_10325 [Clostridium sp.]|uniref:hypothetical protein n=1 Tax=Clostridium sp. TaxID=1506 RepID=UPI0025BD2BC0|nr:hypothetical protein [Clostridium sp.]MCE5221633.1 hypothetical protein [Clostridium sp.]
MRENILLLDIPNFNPKYDSKVHYAYEDKRGSINLKKLLIDTSKGYCMYCYSRILIDEKNSGHLEHSIEKANSDLLKECISNISITCSKCNLSFKRVGEKDRKLSKRTISKFNKMVSCEKSCINICDEYNTLRKQYISRVGSEIILQPFGVKNSNTNIELRIQYDVLNQEFIPSNDYKYNDNEKEFIKKHIKRFNLNDTTYRTKSIIKLCEDVINFEKLPKVERYENLIADLLIEKLEKVELDKAIKLCVIIYEQAIIKNKN